MKTIWCDEGGHLNSYTSCGHRLEPEYLSEYYETAEAYTLCAEFLVECLHIGKYNTRHLSTWTVRGHSSSSYPDMIPSQYWTSTQLVLWIWRSEPILIILPPYLGAPVYAIIHVLAMARGKKAILSQLRFRVYLLDSIFSQSKSRVRKAPRESSI